MNIGLNQWWWSVILPWWIVQVDKPHCELTVDSLSPADTVKGLQQTHVLADLQLTTARVIQEHYNIYVELNAAVCTSQHPSADFIRW